MLIGKRLSGRYKVIEAIGGGGMANVYLAKDVILERYVAIKVLRLDFAHDEDFIKRFHREAHSATSLAHPNIVSIYDVGEEDDIYYIVMEYVAGKTLKQYIQDHAPIQVKEALHIMAQLTSAMAHAHHNNIIHRDIKPQNILINANREVKVTDFGIAVALSSTTITQTNSVLGSVHYLSPEQARGGLSTKRSDIYSLGIVFFELVTGRVPFEGESAVSIALKHLQTNTPSPKRWNPSVPQSVENIILKATAKDPFHRYNSVEELEHDIETALNPDRLYEERFEVPEDHEITKVIPVIKDSDLLKAQDYHSKTFSKHKDVHNNTEPKTTNDNRRQNKIIVSVISAFFVLVALIILAFVFVPKLFMPDDITVPDVSNVPFDEALAELASNGFSKYNIEQQTHEEIEEGYVIKTDPVANAVVKEGTEIIVYKSTGKKTVSMQDFTNQTVDEAKVLLSRLNFIENNIKVKEKHSDNPIGTIIEQFPPEGENVVPSETTVTFTVSSGPEKIKVTNVIGYTEQAAYEALGALGLNVIRDEQFSDDVPKGNVITQQPEAGEAVDKGDQVIIYVSTGPEPKPQVVVFKTIEIPYNPEVEGEVLEVLIKIDDANRDYSDQPIVRLIDQPKTETVELAIDFGEEASYQVIINNEIVAEEIIPYENESTNG
ncbi:Stk1 family PASTA domain-containing Ser/Thr kinase [Bacillus sp. HMF5848]|uniref:Stk1 family PASTA domain-containing Ser/Thr kinase n=1 Tax=Bacillus sp. HMF5848 TaxID=2495421 RepID=UPI000F79A430|nr:Stk1 family PASTA domain-containing Ser/Thr kinase [Bacillus sp. HMF5848]RSK26981.1 Stk1 family PASTA domain-containing Ser/Thr kinase [Bacillus sp. HMF5848]